MTIELEPYHWATDADALRREWLVTNGLGGWASGTVGGANTRRYHGNLVAALRPPVARTVLVSKLDDWAAVGGGRYGLTANEFADGTIDPRGYRHLRKFEVADGLPRWHFNVGGALLRRTLFMPYGHNAVWVVYDYLSGSGPLTLEIAPLLNHRNSHGGTRAGDWNPSVTAVDSGSQVILFPGAHPIWLIYPGASFTPGAVWIKDLYFRVERDRGLPDREDVLRIGRLAAALTPGGSFALLASAERPSAAAYDWRGSLAKTVERHRGLMAAAGLPSGAPAWVSRLVLAADQFIVRRTDASLPPVTEWRGEDEQDAARTVIAGYHWFADWGRDTMIALPGLALSTRRYAEAAGILRLFARYVSRGMLPNRFPDSGETPEYNTADATLWYFHAVDRYLETTGDESLARELYPVLEDLVGWHLRGARYHIHADPADGLLYAGEPGVQLTWMDAKVGDWVVTPRTGKAVEINALWINALRAMTRLAQQLAANPAHNYAALAEKAAASFDRFWYAEGGCLYDVIDGPQRGSDPDLRPNQLLAVSLPYAPLDPHSAKARAVVEACADKLLTPYGLRSLAPDHKDFRPKYGGDRCQRDGAYHQGTVWGWLIGPFVEAHYKVYGDRQKALSFLQPLAAQLQEYGIGSLAEVYDAVEPYTPGGCIAQAWSVSEALRVWSMLNNQ